MRNPCLAVSGLAAASMLMGCDPCAGIADCRPSPQAAVQGRIVEALNGIPSPGVRVTIERTGGVETSTTRATTITNGQGMFELKLDATGPGTALLTVTVESDDSRYQLDDVEVAVSEDREGVTLEPWVRRPFFPYFGELWPRSDFSTRIAGAQVEFSRTGGAELSGSGWVNDVFVTQTDGAGRFPLLGRTVTASGLDGVEGQLTMIVGGRRSPIRTHRMVPTHLYHVPNPVEIFLGGAHFPYVAEVRIAGAPAPGVDVTFRHIGGVAGTPTTFTVRSDARGEFDLRQFIPVAGRDVIFDLTFRAPGLTPRTVRVTQAALEEDAWPRSIGAFDADR